MKINKYSIFLYGSLDNGSCFILLQFSDKLNIYYIYGDKSMSLCDLIWYF
jgi:hypothetical protein